MRDRVQGGKGLQFLPYQAYQIAALKSVIATPMLLAIFQAMNGAGILREKLLRQTPARNLRKACRGVSRRRCANPEQRSLIVSRCLKLNVLAGLVGAAMTFAAACTYAATATSDFQVTATVNANCTLASTNVAFLTYDPLGAGNIQGTGTLTLTCVKGTVPTSIDLNLGLNASGSTRRMNAGGADFITYELYQPTSITPGAACAYTTVWGTGAINGLVPGAAPSKAPRTYNVCGQTTQGQDVSAGSYIDTIQATVNF